MAGFSLLQSSLIPNAGMALTALAPWGDAQVGIVLLIGLAAKNAIQGLGERATGSGVGRLVSTTRAWLRARY